MKNIFLFLVLGVWFVSSNAQEVIDFTYKSIELKTAIGAQVNFMELPSLPEAHLLNIKAAPAPLTDFQEKKLRLDQQR